MRSIPRSGIPRSDPRWFRGVRSVTPGFRLQFGRRRAWAGNDAYRVVSRPPRRNSHPGKSGRCQSRQAIVAPMPFFGHKSARARVGGGALLRRRTISWRSATTSAHSTSTSRCRTCPRRPRQRYEQALEAYQRASEIFDRAKRPEDLAPVSETLEEGRYAMAYTKALIDRTTAAGAAPALLLRSAPRALDRRRPVGAAGGCIAPGARLRCRCAADQGGLSASRPPGDGQRPADGVLERARPLRPVGRRLLQRVRRRRPAEQHCWWARLSAPGSASARRAGRWTVRRRRRRGRWRRRRRRRR